MQVTLYSRASASGAVSGRFTTKRKTMIVIALTTSDPPTQYKPTLKSVFAFAVEPIIYGPAKPPSVPSELIRPIDAAALVPAKNFVGNVHNGGLAALTPKAVSDSPTIAITADEPPFAATAMPAAATRHAMAA